LPFTRPMAPSWQAGAAGTAAVAFFFVYMNDFADHGKILLALMF